MEDLQLASERLAMAGNEFHDSARKAHRRAWVQNMKARLIVGAITLTIVISIIGKCDNQLVLAIVDNFSCILLGHFTICYYY